MVDRYFREEENPEGNVILPYGALFPFSWKRGDLCCDYWFHKNRTALSLFDGEGFDWGSAFSFHLFHSATKSFFANDDAGSVRYAMQQAPAERKNWMNALAMALENDTKELETLMDKHMEKDRYFGPGYMKANAKKWGVDHPDA